MAKKKEITLIANMMMRDSDYPYLSHTIPALKEMCDEIVLMHNGPRYIGFDDVAERLRHNDTIIKGTQRDPNYGLMRNIMLQHVGLGDWVIRWDPDELPTSSGEYDGLIAIKELIRKDLQSKYTNIAVPCYHMVEGNLALKVEYGYAHLRAFKYQQATRWEGNIHENLRNPGATYTIPHSLGMASIHFSYYSPKRLKRKELHYANVPGSGHGPGTLQANIDKGLRVIPENMAFEASDEWLQMVKELE